MMLCSPSSGMMRGLHGGTAVLSPLQQLSNPAPRRLMQPLERMLTVSIHRSPRDGTTSHVRPMGEGLTDPQASHGHADCSSHEGVSFDKSRNSWIARYRESTGIRKHMSFSVPKHGFSVAKKLAESTIEVKLQEGGLPVQEEILDPLTANHQCNVDGVCWDNIRKCWKARWYNRQGDRHGMSFSVAKFGYEEAKQKAVAARYAAEEACGAREKDTSMFTSAVKGVSYSTERQAWVAQWKDASGKRCSKTFATRTYGFEEAKAMAEDARAKGVQARLEAVQNQAK